MSVMATEVWKKYPSVKKLVWNNLKNTVGFMDEMMNYNDISRTDRAKWRGDYSSYMDARNKAEGRYYYVFRCRSKAEEDAGDTKRKMETTITTEIVVKRQKVENREENDKEMEDMVEVENIDLTETAETGDEAEEEEVTATEKMDVTGIRGIFEVDSDEEEEAEGDAGDPQRVVVEDEDGGGEDKLGVASLTKYEPNNSKEENGRCKNKEERATGTKETTITTEILFKRGIFEDSDEDEAAVNEEKPVTGTRATPDGEEEEEVENEEELDIEEKDLVEGDMVKLGTVPQSERPEFEGLCGVDKREGVFIFHHGYKSEEKLYNHLVRFGKVVNMANEDGSEFEDPGNLPPIVVVEFERAENEKRDIILKGNRQKWKMFKTYFENVTLKEGRHRWDTCDDENILEVIRNNDQIMIVMKSSVEENEFYSKMTSIYYRGEKVLSCDIGKLCMVTVTEFKEIRMPGRIERLETFHTKKCIDMVDIKIIETK